jgi:GNAT superfamily N-acetyltransferase
LTPLESLISRADVSDASEILRLQKLAYQSEAGIYHDWSIPPLTQTLAEIEAEFTKKVFLKATLDGRLIGSVRAFLEAATCHIGRLIVEPAIQGRGIGKQLLAAIEAEFTAADRFELFTGDRSARNLAFYRKLGYEAFKTERVSPEMALVYLEKRRQPRAGCRCSNTSS